PRRQDLQRWGDGRQIPCRAPGSAVPEALRLKTHDRPRTELEWASWSTSGRSSIKGACGSMKSLSQFAVRSVDRDDSWLLNPLFRHRPHQNNPTLRSLSQKLLSVLMRYGRRFSDPQRLLPRPIAVAGNVKSR